MPLPGRSRTMRVLAALVLLASLFATFAFGHRTYGTFLTLRSAYEIGVPAASAVRAWMSLDYVARAYDIPLAALVARLDLPETTDGDILVSELADERGVARIEAVRDVQAAIADLAPASPDTTAAAPEEESGGLADAFLAALLAYSYPALGLILLLGAVGAPVPTGFTTVLAGSLAAGGLMTWPLATAVAVIASVAGDIAGYGIGRFAGDFVSRHGRWLGYSGHRKARVEWLFARWGGVTVLMTRTLASHLSSLASLLAGVSRYAFAAFLAFAAVGRILWTAAYFGLGYFIGSDLDAASGFLGSLSGLLISALIAVAAAAYLWRGAVVIPR
jgi:membrane-associated protein